MNLCPIETLGTVLRGKRVYDPNLEHPPSGGWEVSPCVSV